MIGRTLGPYRVLEKLGEGGMGEVYKATDTNLKRAVAIKVLPTSVASDVERLARFQREAEILAALNHPNIAAIYGLERSAAITALVMELIEGPTLADRIAHGAIPIDEALPIAKQIAEALEAAHERGIIHRDLKPANVKVRPDGAVKVLDFGLAKAMEPIQDVSPSQSMSPTITSPVMTRAGVILGTAAYMSPEQARGYAIDKRTDIWAFGCVLYEMLTGRRPFAGETVSDLIAAILDREPDWVLLPDRLPSTVVTLLKRCLDRNVKRRLRDIGDARIEIDDAITRPYVRGAPASGPARVTWRRWIAPAVVAGAALAIAGFALLRYPGGNQTPDRLVVSTLLPPAGGQFDFGFPWALPALSPDGTQVVFGAKTEGGTTQLWLRRLDSPEAHPIPGTEGAASPFWSPDGRWIAFGQGTTLKKVEARGGAPVLITEVPAIIRGGSWSADDVILFGINRSPGAIVRVAASGGQLTPVTSFEKARETAWHLFPVFLPDGERFLYAQSDADGWRILAGDLRHPERAGTIVTQTESMALPAQGRIVYLQGAALWARDFDLATLKVGGEPQLLAQGLDASVAGDATFTAFTVSPSGLVAYETSGAGGRSRLIWVDRQGNQTGTLGDAVNGTIGSIAIAPDQKRVAIDIEDRPGKGDIWIYEIGRPAPARLTFDEAWDRDPFWSPDSRTIYFRSNRSGRFDLYRTSADLTSPEELLSEDDIDKQPTGVSRDGKGLFYATRGNESRNDIWVVPLQPRAAPFPLLQNPYPENGGVPSPDDKWIAYIANNEGRVEVYATLLSRPASRQQVSLGGGGMPIRWRRDGKELFYPRLGGQLMSVETDLSNGILKSGRPQKLFDRANVGVFDVSADGERFLVVDSGSGRTLTLLQNWNPMPRR